MIVLIALALLVGDSVTFVEAERGQSMISLLGEDVTLSCSPDPTHSFPSMLTDVNCSDTYFIYWQKNDGGYISYCLYMSVYDNNNNNTVNYSDNKYNLHISNVQQSDAGQYRCVTSDGISQETPLIVQLNVFEPSCSADTQTNEVGDHVSLICSIPIYRALQWIASNGTVIASRSGQSNQPLVFNFTAKEEHNFQTFTCTAISESGTYIPECEVTPLEYTFITISPQISRVKQGDNASFICNARLGARAPHRYDYTWLQDDNIVLQGLNTTSYTFRDVQLTDIYNATQVQCKASDNGTEEMESSKAILYVYSACSVTELRTPNPGDEELTCNPNTTASVSDNCAFSFNTLTKYLLAACVVLLIPSFCVNVVLVICLVKSRKANNIAENLPTGGSQMTYADLQQRDVTQAEYESCRVKPADNNDTYAAVDGEYEVPQTDNVGNSGDAGLYELPNA